jgi:hypothetical protein
MHVMQEARALDVWRCQIHERNQYFMDNPKRAGDKIWGKERGVPVFNSSNNCKDPLYR